MSRARKIPKDLHTVAQLAGTTATVVEGAAIAAEKAQAAAEFAADVKDELTKAGAKASKGHRKGLLLLLFLAGLAAVGFVVWKKSAGGSAESADITDLRAESKDFAGSMP
jgi:hypothetical protein